jgi:hypothetical protein
MVDGKGVSVVVGVCVSVGTTVGVCVGLLVIVCVNSETGFFCPDSISEFEGSTPLQEVANKKTINSIKFFLFFMQIPNNRITAPIIPKHKPFSLNMYCMI